MTFVASSDNCDKKVIKIYIPGNTISPNNIRASSIQLRIGGNGCCGLSNEVNIPIPPPPPPEPTKEPDICLPDNIDLYGYTAIVSYDPVNCRGGHVCNRAIFDFYINSTLIGQANLNNLEDGGYRETVFIINEHIISGSSTTVQLVCALNNCHNGIGRVTIKDPQGNTVLALCLPNDIAVGTLLCPTPTPTVTPTSTATPTPTPTPIKYDCGNCGPYSVQNIVRNSRFGAGWNFTNSAQLGPISFYNEGSIEIEHETANGYLFDGECPYVIISSEGASIINKNYFNINGDILWADLPDGRLLLGSSFSYGFGNGTTECFFGDIMQIVDGDYEESIYRLLKVNCDGSVSNFTNYIQYVLPGGCIEIDWDDNRPGLSNPYTGDLSTFINNAVTPTTLAGFGSCLIFASTNANGGPGTPPRQEILDLINPTITYNFS